MQVYGSILPGAATVARLLPQQAAEARRRIAAAQEEVRLSPGAKHKLKVIRWHERHGGKVSDTAEHFSHSRTTIQSWRRRYEVHGVAGLEDKSHRPHHVRQSTWSRDLEQQVLKLREQYPRWGKDKLVVLLRREGVVVLDGRAHPQSI